MEIIIFCGIQATGKTSFYLSRFFRSHVHLSLDILNTRNREQRFMDVCFQTQQAFVIDNTNLTKADREKYITQAKQYKYKVVAYYFQSKIDDALQRNSYREGKQNIPEVAVRGAFNKLEIPSLNEGFDELYYVEIDENNEFAIKPWTNEI